MALSTQPVRSEQGRRGSSWLSRFVLTLLGLLALSVSVPATAQEKFVKISRLADYNFGTITNLSIDRSLSNSVCVYSAKLTPGYNVTATGSGAGGAFLLTGGGGTLEYEAQWASQPNMSSGTSLIPNVPLTGLITSGQQQSCNSGPPSTSSLIVVLRAAALQAAPSGTFSGTLTVIIGSE